MKRFYLLSMLAIASIAAPSYSSPLEGQMDKGYDLPYLWSSYAGYSNPDWMAGVDNSKTLAQISLPGTHNSLSTSGNLFSITQTLDAADQLDMGIRYFDVRFKYHNGVLQAYHGDFIQPTTFDEFMGKVSNFLWAYPSETVLIKIQNEAGAKTNERAFFNRFKAVANKYRAQQSIPSSITPRLGDVRGKFIFIRDFNVFEGRIGLDRRNFIAQDKYTVATNWELYRKWEDVKTQFEKVKSNNGKNISLNYLSGSNITFPYFVASGKSGVSSHAPQLWTGFSGRNKNTYPDFQRRDCFASLCSIYFTGTNQLTNSWIKNGKLANNLGVVVMDFPGGALVDNIIQTNNPNNKSSASFIIYDGANYKGNALTIKSDVIALNGWDNKMSSWVLPKGWEVRFYEHENFKGNYYTRRNSGNATGFDNKVSSIKILKGAPSLVIYDSMNQKGNSLSISSDTKALNSWDNKMSSWTIPEGWQVRFYRDENFKGDYYTRDHSDNATGFDNIVSSIKILKGAPSLIIYDAANYGGNALDISSDIKALGNWDNKMSSWIIPEGWQVRFYEHENFKGNYYTRDHSGNADGFDKKVSSIQILKRP